MDHQCDLACPNRRRILLTAAGAALLAGCSTYGDRSVAPSGAFSAPAAPGPASGESSAAPGDTGAGTGAGTGASGAGRLVALADVPVGGGRVLRDAKVVVTRPSADVVKAFSAVCTHAGCTVGEVTGGTINCPCHGSRFAVADGSVVRGPARTPLAPVKVRVSGTEVVRG